MKPKSSQHDQGDLFRSHLDQILNREHPLFVLANQINWSVFDKKFGSLYSEKERWFPKFEQCLKVESHTLTNENHYE